MNNIDWPNIIILLLGNGVITSVLTLILTQRYQNTTWIKDRKLEIYSRLSRLIIEWELILNHGTKKPPTLGATVAEALLLMNNPKLEQKLVKFSQGTELLEILREDNDERSYELEIIITTLGPQVRRDLKRDLLGANVQDMKRISIGADLLAEDELFQALDSKIKNKQKNTKT